MAHLKLSLSVWMENVIKSILITALIIATLEDIPHWYYVIFRLAMCGLSALLCYLFLSDKVLLLPADVKKRYRLVDCRDNDLRLRIYCDFPRFYSIN